MDWTSADVQVEATYRAVPLFAEQRGAAGSSQASLMLRGFTYQAIGQLGERAPSLVRGDTDVPRQLFHALAVEPPGVRSSLQESLAALSYAYKGISGIAI